MKVRDQLQDQVSLPPPWESALSHHSVGDLLDFRAGMDTWGRESVFCLELNHDSSVVHPVDKSL